MRLYEWRVKDKHVYKGASLLISFAEKIPSSFPVQFLSAPQDKERTFLDNKTHTQKKTYITNEDDIRCKTCISKRFHKKNTFLWIKNCQCNATFLKRKSYTLDWQTACLKTHQRTHKKIFNSRIWHLLWKL